jgi:hypothetical protein
VRRDLIVAPGTSVQCAFYIAVGTERDGAQATVSVMRRRGWRALLTATREALSSMEQATGNDGVDRLVNRNLLFAYFYGVGRAHLTMRTTTSCARARRGTPRCDRPRFRGVAWTFRSAARDTGLARELLVTGV